jgi:hypothetical protein
VEWVIKNTHVILSPPRFVADEESEILRFAQDDTIGKEIEP